MSDKVYVGRKCQSFQSYGEYQPFSRVTMWYGEGDGEYYTAGDDTGRTMECENPWATQQIVDNVLKKIKGFVYRPFEAKGCEIDPAAELGDAVTICGTYTMIGSMRKNYKNGGLIDIGLPGGKEINHEYPFKSPQDRELKRRVKLGQAYQGVKITRAAGLTIVEVQEDGKEGAKVVLNSKELSFYDAGGGRVLYFDPTSGTYKFMGELNVNDKFVVDKKGNVKIAGSLNLATGDIYWGDTPPNKKRYAASTSGPWHDTMLDGDIYCCDWDYNSKVWKEPYKFKGQDGTNGNDASVNRSNVERALAYAKSLGSSFMAVDSVGSPIIYGGKIYGSEIYAGGVVGSGGVVGTGSVISLTDSGIDMYNDLNDTYLQITSKYIQGLGGITALSGGVRPILLTAMQVMVGMGMGSESARGMEVGPSRTEFYGPVHFNGETTGATFVLA